MVQSSEYQPQAESDKPVPGNGRSQEHGGLGHCRPCMGQPVVIY